MGTIVPKLRTHPPIDTNDRLLDDGFGNVWEKCDHEDCALEIVRPGKVQCERCEYENVPHSTTTKA
jgi:hypothetical protein